MVTIKLEAVRARAMTSEEKLAHALDMAERANLLYRSQYHGPNEYGDQVFSVPDRPHAKEYRAVWRTATGDFGCNCTTGHWGMPCAHIGSAYHQWRLIERAMTAAAAEASRQYQTMGEWLEGRGY